MKRRIFSLFLILLLLPITAFAEEAEEHIKWVEFHVPYRVLERAMHHDIETYHSDTHLSWTEVLAVLAAKSGGSFSGIKAGAVDDLVYRLQNGENIEELSAELEHFDYYLEAYSAILGEFLGEHRVEAACPNDPNKKIWEERYGLKAFSPIAAGFAFSHYDDFGASRNYGYRRRHLGHDIFGAVGTPIIAIESGVVEAMGWNRYGGWRIGIRSFDGLRYYYYAHLRQNRPFHPDIKEGSVVSAGDVIGYMGRTGYSNNENVNGIKENHLHWGMQLIFHPDQVEGNNEIWVDVYALTKLLQKNQSETIRVPETKEFYRKYKFDEPNLFGKR